MASTFRTTSSTRLSTSTTFPFTTLSLSFKLPSTLFTAPSSSSSARRTRFCSSSRASNVLWNAAAFVCRVERVRRRVRIWGMCGRRGERRLRTGASWSVCGCGLGGGADWLDVAGEPGWTTESDPANPCWLCPRPCGPVPLRWDEFRALGLLC